MTERAQDLLRTLPGAFYHGGASASHGRFDGDRAPLAPRPSPCILRGRSARKRLVHMAALGSGYFLLSAVARVPFRESRRSSVIFLPLLCLAGVLYSIRAYNNQTDMRSLEFTSTYLIGIVTALCLSLAAVYFLGTFGSENQPRRLLIPLAFVVFAPAALLVRRLLFDQNCPADRDERRSPCHWLR